jgi:hypothetical protein
MIEVVNINEILSLTWLTDSKRNFLIYSGEQQVCDIFHLKTKYSKQFDTSDKFHEYHLILSDQL